MKFIPLGNRPNISATRNGSSNISMQVDSRGLPRISWIESKNGHNEIHYGFWDGLQWTYHQNPMVGWAEEEIVSSGNSLVLGSYENPSIVFSRRLPNSRSVISVAAPLEEGWSLDELDVDYDTKWTGLFTYGYNLNPSSSSSSEITSSSSSRDSSSSSSTDDARIFVTSYDSNSVFRVYGIHNYGWKLLTEKTMSVNMVSSFKHVMCGKFLGVTWSLSNNIYYNFFNIDTEEWLYESTQVLTLTGLLSSDVEGFYNEDVGQLYFAAILEDTNSMSVYNVMVDTNGLISYLGSSNTIESEAIYVTGSNDYISSGYSDISISRDSISGDFNIIAFGARLTKYAFDGVEWVKTYGSVEGSSCGFSPDKLITKSYDGVVNMSFSNFGGDVYHFYEDSSDAFDIVYPNLSVFNEQRLLLVKYQDGKLANGDTMPCTWWERVGDILRESITRVNVMVVDAEDPLCYTSSSSSSSTSSSSSSSISYTSSSSSSSTSLSSSSSSTESGTNSSSSSSCDLCKNGVSITPSANAISFPTGSGLDPNYLHCWNVYDLVCFSGDDPIDGSHSGYGIISVKGVDFGGAWYIQLGGITWLNGSGPSDYLENATICHGTCPPISSSSSS